MLKYEKCKDCSRRRTDDHCFACLHHYDLSKLKDSEKRELRDYYDQEK